MLLQQNVLHFINTHRFHTMRGCNFFYKSHEGKFIDSDVRTASIAGVNGKEIINKRDVELRWAKFSDQYQKSDQLALNQTEAIIKIEENIDLSQKEVSVFILKQAAVDLDGNSIGIFGAMLYIDEISFAELFHTFDFIHHALCIKPSIATTKMLLAPTLAVEKLAQREKECAHFLCLGMSAREIALQLNLSKRTVESYIMSMKDKLDVVSKSELIMKLLDNNL